MATDLYLTTGGLVSDISNIILSTETVETISFSDVILEGSELNIEGGSYETETEEFDLLYSVVALAESSAEYKLSDYTEVDTSCSCRQYSLIDLDNVLSTLHEISGFISISQVNNLDLDRYVLLFYPVTTSYTFLSREELIYTCSFITRLEIDTQLSFRELLSLDLTIKTANHSSTDVLVSSRALGILLSNYYLQASNKLSVSLSPTERQVLEADVYNVVAHYSFNLHLNAAFSRYSINLDYMNHEVQEISAVTSFIDQNTTDLNYYINYSLAVTAAYGRYYTFILDLNCYDTKAFYRILATNSKSTFNTITVHPNNHTEHVEINLFSALYRNYLNLNRTCNGAAGRILCGMGLNGGIVSANVKIKRAATINIQYPFMRSELEANRYCLSKYTINSNYISTRYHVFFKSNFNYSSEVDYQVPILPIGSITGNRLVNAISELELSYQSKDSSVLEANNLVNYSDSINVESNFTYCSIIENNLITSILSEFELVNQFIYRNNLDSKLLAVYTTELFNNYRVNYIDSVNLTRQVNYTKELSGQYLDKVFSEQLVRIRFNISESVDVDMLYKTIQEIDLFYYSFEPFFYRTEVTGVVLCYKQFLDSYPSTQVVELVLSNFTLETD